jgi:hypothetical protein
MHVQITQMDGRTLTLALSCHTGEYIPFTTLIPLEIVRQAHPSVLLHLQDSSSQKVFILFLQEVKRDPDTVFRHAQLKTSRRQEKLQLHIQAHLLLVVKKINDLLEYQGSLTFADALSFLQHITHSLVHD